MTEKQSAIVIGGGSAGLMAAQTIAAAGHGVAIYDRMPSLGRKFLMAGRGGLNLSHSEDFEAFANRYDAPQWLRPHLLAFPPAAVRAWALDLGEPTFSGTSGRIFPRSFKSSPLLRAWLRRLGDAGVAFMPKHRWTGFDDGGQAVFADSSGARVAVRAQAIVLALGGASWPRLGSDAAWTGILQSCGIAITPFAPANCGFDIAWSAHFRERFAGTHLKTVRLALDGDSARGSLAVTQRGIEGGIVYGFSRRLREKIALGGQALVHVDLRPDVDGPELAHRLARQRGSQSTATFLRKSAGLEPAAIGLVREAAHASGGLPQQAAALAALIKAVPLRLTGASAIERAISCAGGIARQECDAQLMLKRLPGVFAAGEMLDWEAPTGGYLLQACFATGFAAGCGASNWLDRAAVRP